MRGNVHFRARTAPRRAGFRLLLASVFLFVITLPRQCFADGASETDIKATYLYKLAYFVEWPAGAFSSANAPLEIVVLGGDPVASALKQVCQGEKVSEHPLVVRQERSLGSVGHGHILFVPGSERSRFGEVIQTFGNRSVLTVGDGGSFTDLGGMIQFTSSGKRVAFKINKAAAGRAGLRLSSKLLRLAEL